MRKEREVNFDMDGTLVDFYSVPNWLNYLQEENTAPYDIAEPLLNLAVLARHIHRLQYIGYKVNIISWTSKRGTEAFNFAVETAKKEWLRKHLPSVTFDNIYIIEYGTPKHLYGKGYLFDDEENNRKEWKGTAFSEKDILNILRLLD